MNMKFFTIATICAMTFIGFAAEKKALYTPVKFPTATAQIKTEKIEDPIWYTDYEVARLKAKEEKKVIMLLFTGSDWCGACQALESRIFKEKEFKVFASKKLILVKLDFPKKTVLDSKTKAQNNKLKKYYKPDGYPTCFFITADEKNIGKVVGYTPKWMEKAKKVVK